MPRPVRVLAAVEIEKSFHVVGALVARLGNEEVRPAEAVNHSEKPLESLRPEGATSRYLTGRGHCIFSSPSSMGILPPSPARGGLPGGG